MSGMSRADEIMAKLGKAKVIPQFEKQIRFSVAADLNLLPYLMPMFIIIFTLKVKKTATNWSWEDEELMYEMNQVWYIF
jgi:hypothetical protein